jgi:hypothetical protein
MNWSAFSAELVGKFSTQPQNAYRVELACRQIAEGLQVLAGLGFPFHLEPGHMSGSEWPKMMFNATAPNGVLVYGPTQQSELGEGWFDSLAKAREWHGQRTQLIGRGGKRLAGLPVPVGRQLTNVERDLPVARDSAEEREARIAEAKALLAKTQAELARPNGSATIHGYKGG